MNAVLLSESVESYLACRDVSPQYAQNVRGRVSRFCQWSGVDSPTAFSERNLSAFLKSLPCSPATKKGYWGDLLVVWRWCADCGYCDYPAQRKIYRPQVPASVPMCWTVSEVRCLLTTAGAVKGDFPTGVCRSDYWSALIRMGYETGLRVSDLMRMDRRQINNQLLVTVSNKTGVRTFHAISNDTEELLSRLPKNAPLRFCYTMRNFSRCFRRIVKASGVRPGTFKWLRRTSGSYVEASNPGQGSKHLGHTSPSTFRKFYDARFVADTASCPQPPPL
jgi:hypothetical protein